MPKTDRNSAPSNRSDVAEYHTLIIGAGIAGLYQLHRLRELGFSVRIFEAGNGVGGTWYWNRYPGARLDSESYTFCYSFSQELLDEWEWSERFVSQPELLSYYEYVADKFDLHPHIELGVRVSSATFDESENVWEVEAEDGRRARARFVITAVGALSAPTLPRIEGRESFEGEAYHTARWPHEPVELEGKRVGVIGTGSSGVQMIQECAKVAKRLTVFQRTPNYCMPLRNAPIGEEGQRRLKASYPEIFRRCRKTLGGFLYEADPRSALDCTPDEREAYWEQQHTKPGFALWLGNFQDILADEEANALATEFVVRKIRERVDDPEVAEKLIPKGHGFGTRRVPLETSYYEVYNQDNVELVDVLETPIDRITPRGVLVGGVEYELDVLVYATGFDAITGALDRIDFRGVGGRKLKEKWGSGPKTYLGMTSVGFPNLLTLVGPHNGSTFCNMPRCIEQNVDWVADLLAHMDDEGYERVEATEDAEMSWTEHCQELASMTLLTKTDSWFVGVNVNLPEKKRTVLQYMGGAPLFEEKCNEVAAKGYEGFTLE